MRYRLTPSRTAVISNDRVLAGVWRNGLYSGAAAVTATQTDAWINDVVSAYNGLFFLALKTKEILTLATRWMNPEDMLRNKQSHKEKYCMIHRR